MESDKKVKKVQKISKGYTLKSFKNNNSKLLECGLIDKKRYGDLEIIRLEIVAKFIESEHGKV